MEVTNYKAILEGLLFASGDDGLTIKQMATILEISQSSVEHLIEELKYDYDHSNRGIMIMESHQVFHLSTKPEHSLFHKRLLETPNTQRMSQAALETLAIIAYKQPITRTEIDEIRGVKSDRSVQTLLARSFIEEVGRKEGVGRPVLFGTSKDFLTFFGLTSIQELPPLPEQVDTESIEQEADLFFERFQEQIEENELSSSSS
ncbi:MULTISPECIES: SMC-Scp complex subunit ScpB [unclassified Virgibacillus]|uniref:SMC-Scp complex subunit ScpB n=1 Tax=unclassified Virgibacillus TaxID=2620237 RepID=UPI0024DEADA0|nr:SMC-Scp complex subunit ScpB [Virgibacillus sp. LDC-1]